MRLNRRLAAEGYLAVVRMLDTLIRQRAVTESAIRGIARKLAVFYVGVVDADCRGTVGIEGEQAQVIHAHDVVPKMRQLATRLQ